MFVPDDQYGGGEGDGQGRGVAIVIPVPILRPKEFKGVGEHRVLLVKVTSTKCECCDKIPIKDAVTVISDVTCTPTEKVEIILKESLKDFSKKSIRTGEGEYVKSLVGILSLLFCEKQLEFSSEKIS